MKYCSGCDKNLELSEFGKSGQKKNDGLRYKCNKCRRKQRKIKRQKDNTKYLEYERKPEVKRKWKNLELKRKYNITLDEFEQMKIDQYNKCMICKKEESHKQKRGLSVDHCHETNKVRGLLCHRCNCAIGMVKEDIIILNNIITYLKESKE